MRVWHILERYFPDYGGGAAITTRDVCRGLVARGHEVRVLCADNTASESYTIRTDWDGPIRVDRVNLPYFLSSDPEGWQLGTSRWKKHEHRISLLIDHFLAGWRPDVVDYHTARPFGEECLASLARHDVPIVATLHDAWLICLRVMLLRSPTSAECEGPSRLKCIECMYSNYDGSHLQSALRLPFRIARLGPYFANRLKRRRDVRRLVRGAIARSEFMAEVHRPHLVGEVRHIPFGIDLTGRPDRVKRDWIRPHRFGFVAGFQQTKGIRHVLDAMQSLKREGVECELHVWGPGGDAGIAEIVTRDLNDRVFVHGMYSPEERWAVYGMFDTAVMATTVREPLGRVPLEAAAMGAPTIAPAVGGIKETIRDEIDGLHYAFRDPSDLQRQMRRILLEEGLFARLRTNLLPVLDTRDQVCEVESFYLEVLAGSQGVRSPSEDVPSLSL